MQDIKIKTYIEKELRNLHNKNIFFISAQVGTTSLQSMVNYLYSLSYAFKQTIVCLNLAKTVASEMNMEKYIQFFNEKIDEEVGHDIWPLEDIKNIVNSGAIKPEINRHCIALMDYLKQQITLDPRSYIIYMTVAELTAVVIGPDFVNNLKKSCGIKDNQITAIGNHIELDVEHADEDFKYINSILDDGYSEDEIYKKIDAIVIFYDQFFSSLITDINYEQPLHI